MTPENIILHYNKDAKTPIDIFLIIEKYGYTINFTEQPEDIWGSYNFKEKTLKINKSLKKQQQKFIAAHMFIHMLNDQDEGVEKRGIFNAEDQPKEILTNQLTAELLIPKIYLDILINQKNICNPQNLADIFDVPLNAIILRLKNLGYL